TLGRSCSSTSFRPFCPVFGPTLCPTIYTGRVERAPDDVITNTGKIFDPASAYQYNGVFLKVVPLARNIGVHLFAVCEANPRHLAHSRIGLLRGCRVHTSTYTPALGAGIKRRRL